MVNQYTPHLTWRERPSIMECPRLFGLPGLIGAMAFFAAISAFGGPAGLVTAILAVMVVLLTMGAAMTLVKNR